MPKSAVTICRGTIAHHADVSVWSKSHSGMAKSFNRSSGVISKQRITQSASLPDRLDGIAGGGLPVATC